MKKALFLVPLLALFLNACSSSSSYFSTFTAEGSKSQYKQTGTVHIKDDENAVSLYVNAASPAAITLTGLGMPLSSVTLSVWAGDLSAPEDYDRLVKWLSSAYMLGSLVTGPVPGLLADRFGGSYVPAYGLFLFFLLISMLLIQTVYRRTGVGGRPQR